MNVPPFAKHLAANDKKTRDKSIKALAAFLSHESQEPIPKLEMDKLWKGIFYCFWMSDKPLVQQALASEMADLLLTIPSTPRALEFLQGFWSTTVREWSGIDRLRIDKYYMLVRRFINATFRLLIRSDWDKSACDTYVNILTSAGGPLCSTDNRVPTSLAYHICDVYLEELEKALASSRDTDSDSTPAPAPLCTVLSPFLHLAARTLTKTTYARVEAEVFKPLFSSLVPSSVAEDPHPAKRIRLDPQAWDSGYPTIISNSCFDDPSTGVAEPLVVRKRLLQRLFEVAGEPETRDASRRRLYAFYQANVDEDDLEEG
ncbi:unnamed protein product [Mycena citricolor]|uniref:Nop52-domain-containing protein n=1 Tax=Mycena citricolor TaxID=2018698 RepID=A0AAD2GUU2_9AGAR|nr:unnamed protein product [Mycena citricolor]